MDLMRFIIAKYFLVLSGQPLVLFMPAGVQMSTEIANVSNNGGC